ISHAQPRGITVVVPAPNAEPATQLAGDLSQPAARIHGCVFAKRVHDTQCFAQRVAISAGTPVDQVAQLFALPQRLGFLHTPRKSAPATLAAKLSPRRCGSCRGRAAGTTASRRSAIRREALHPAFRGTTRAKWA